MPVDFIPILRKWIFRTIVSCKFIDRDDRARTGNLNQTVTYVLIIEHRGYLLLFGIFYRTIILRSGGAFISDPTLTH
jgi:hypothetical protein